MTKHWLPPSIDSPVECLNLFLFKKITATTLNTLQILPPFVGPVFSGPLFQTPQWRVVHRDSGSDTAIHSSQLP
jgi:hypothetical protein